MIDAHQFIEAARARAFDFYTGVPCSFLTPLINAVIGSAGLSYIGAASEGEAVAIAAGAWLAGRQTVVMCQNSGLGNAVNPLTSLNHPFAIPTLLIVTWRGEPGIKDEPQHAVMGALTQRLLEVIGIAHAPFPTRADAIGAALDGALAEMGRRELPFAFVMAQGSVREEELRQTPLPTPPRGERDDRRERGSRPRRAAVLERMLALVPDSAAIVATTGKTGRELFTLADRAQHLYQVGSMGCASAMGLGIALNTPRRVVVIDGDGAALMKLGTLATIGAYAPGNLVHLLLDNGVHDSTGGQATVSPGVDFAGIALACGYRRAACCDSLGGFAAALGAALAADGPALIHMRIVPGSMAKLGRPNIPPHEVARRFRAFLAPH
ncbi:MAG: phosphonopyruvate decarboxylase [Alphaproteobacteria bacterium]|nr:phosphonopyruvate decarboxylase [Alphaproteobacteria bacterium]